MARDDDILTDVPGTVYLVDGMVNETTLLAIQY